MLNPNFATDQITPAYTFNQSTGTIVFDLRKNQQDLMGTYGLVNPFVNPLTMGDIYFDVQATANTPDIMDAKAFIEFHSVEPRQVASGQRWEPPVYTNVVHSYYSNCTDTVYCNCKIPTPSERQCTKLLSLCWWWWIIIGAGIVILFILIRKKKK